VSYPEYQIYQLPTSKHQNIKLVPGSLVCGVWSAVTLAADYYLEMFASWGAEELYWIPVQVGGRILSLVQLNYSDRRVIQRLPLTPPWLRGRKMQF
jgi:hypothetical protein